LGAASLGACRQPTQVTLDITTTVDCADIGTTTVSFTTLGMELRNPAPLTEAMGCKSQGEIGTVVLAPSQEDDSPLIFTIATVAVRGTTKCAPPNYPGCIVARRSMRYSPHDNVTVNVSMDQECLGVPCSATTSCFQGLCYPTTCVGNADCNSVSVPGPVDAGGVGDAGGGVGDAGAD
jgi:hypothetical protein